MLQPSDFRQLFFFRFFPLSLPAFPAAQFTWILTLVVTEMVEPMVAGPSPMEDSNEMVGTREEIVAIQGGMIVTSGEKVPIQEQTLGLPELLTLEVILGFLEGSPASQIAMIHTPEGRTKEKLF